MRAAEMFKSYRKIKQECIVLEFQMQYFQGIPHKDVIESMNFSKPQGERVQDSKISDKTGKTAIYYRKVAERLDDDWFESLLDRYQYLQEELAFFEYAATQLSGRMPEFVADLVMDGMAWDELAIKYRVSHSMVGKYRKKAEKELNALYEVRDKMANDYMLS